MPRPSCRDYCREYCQEAPCTHPIWCLCWPPWHSLCFCYWLVYEKWSYEHVYSTADAPDDERQTISADEDTKI